jgi:predicted ArsR family transcriptional regulator
MVNSDARERNDSGQYVETITADAVLAVMGSRPDPIVTAPEIADQLGCSSEAARRKLTALHKQGKIKRRTVSANAVVWWLTDDPATADPDAKTAADRVGAGLFAGEDGEAFAEAVEASREQFDEEYEERHRDLFGQ